MVDAGIPYAAGTDSGPPGRFPGFFGALGAAVDGGSGTHAGAGHRRRHAPRGDVPGRRGSATLEPSKWADFVVLDANPLTDISNSRKIRARYIAAPKSRRSTRPVARSFRLQALALMIAATMRLCAASESGGMETIASGRVRRCRRTWRRQRSARAHGPVDHSEAQADRPRPSSSPTKAAAPGPEAFVYAKGATGDPHKVVFATNNVWLLPLGSAVGYRWSDLQPVAAVAFDEFMLWVNSTAPYQDVAGFLDAARSAGRSGWRSQERRRRTRTRCWSGRSRRSATSRSRTCRSGPATKRRCSLPADMWPPTSTTRRRTSVQWRAGTIRPLCVFSPTRLNYADVVTAEPIVVGHPDMHGSGAADRALSDAANGVAAQGRHRRAGRVLPRGARRRCATPTSGKPGSAEGHRRMRS